MRRRISRILHAIADALIWLTVRVIVWAVDNVEKKSTGTRREDFGMFSGLKVGDV